MADWLKGKIQETKNERFEEIKGVCEVLTIKTQRVVEEDNMWEDALVAKDLI